MPNPNGENVTKGMVDNYQFLQYVRNADFPWVETKRRRAVTYTLNVPAAFDIETSSFYEAGQRRAIMYIWQFGIGDYVTYGRTWQQFINLCDNIQAIFNLNRSNWKMLVFVHNLPYEFQWIRKQFEWDKVFLIDRRKPCYAVTGGIEFRCSLKLSGGRSLEAVGNELLWHDVRKLKGNLDYSKLRTEYTPLTEKEMAYCENDIRVLCAYIEEKIKQDGDITKIPLTNTSYVRRLVKEECFRRWKTFKPLIERLILTPGTYEMLRRAYRGGAVHCSPRFATLFNAADRENPFNAKAPLNREERRTFIRNVASFDFASSYPAVACLAYYPMSEPIEVPYEEANSNLDYYLENYCCLFDWTAWNLEPRYDEERGELCDYEAPLSASKCWNDRPEYMSDIYARRGYFGERISNGRIVRATRVNTTITELDYQTYSDFYQWSGEMEEVRNLVIFERGRLPKQIVNAILDLYEQKTQLKGVKGKELEYMIAKNMLNAIYGMMVTNIVREILKYDTDNAEFLDPETPDLEGEIDKYNRKRGRVLYYPWGVWITAHARNRLYKGVYACGRDYVYSDTDSIKIVNALRHMGFILSYNSDIRKQIREAAKYYHQPISRFCPTDPKGKSHPMGVWDFDAYYKRFKSIGAKRYIVEKVPLGAKNHFAREMGKTFYQLTVAGTSKRLALEYLADFVDPYKDDEKKAIKGTALPVEYCHRDPFDLFHDGTVIPKDKSGRLVLSYLDDETEGIVADYNGVWYHYHELSSVHMENSTYSLGLSSDFREFIYACSDPDFDENGDMIV